MKGTAKLPQSKPSSGASAKKKATFGTSGARGVGKDSTNTEDSHRLGNRPKAWGRKKSGHQDQKLAVAQGGSVN